MNRSRILASASRAVSFIEREMSSGIGSLMRKMSRCWARRLPIFYILIGTHTLADVVTPSNSADAVRRAENATVIIYAKSSAGMSQGSGFFVHTNGWLLTNYHVIEGHKNAVASFRDGSKIPVKHVVAFSAKYDLALLQLATNSEHMLELADPSTTQNGMKIHTMGAPNGLGWTHTEGIVEGVLREREQGIDVLQHTAKIDHGSSGGPAFDEHGYVHTINTWGRPRKVQKTDGKYELIWDNPRYQGAYCRDITRFLKSKKNPQYLQVLAGKYANHEVAAWLLFACSETDYVLRNMRESIYEMDLIREQTVDTSRKTTRGTAKVISDIKYWSNVDVFNRSIDEFENLKYFILDMMPLAEISDPSLRTALNNWYTCIQNMNDAVDKMIESQGKNSQAFNRLYDAIKSHFLQANDYLYFTLKTSCSAFRAYRPYSTLNSPVTNGRINELWDYYYNRRLELR